MEYGAKENINQSKKKRVNFKKLDLKSTVMSRSLIKKIPC